MRYLGVGPADYDELPFYWRERALTAISAENWAEQEHAAHQTAQQRAKRT